MVAAFKRGTFGTGVVRGNGLALQQSGVVSLGISTVTVADSSFPNVSILAKTTGVNSATNNTFLDSSSNAYAITRVGTATQGSFTPYWPAGYWSNFNPNSDNGIGVASNDAFNMGTGDFTVEAWVNTAALPTTNAFQTSSGGYQVIFATGPNSSAAGSQLYIGVTNLFFDISVDGGGPISVAHNMVAGQWYHVAITRSGTTFRAFINGALVQTATSSVSWENGYALGIMRAEPIGGFGGAWWYGYVSNFRMVKGTAVYTSAFTPSATPLTAIANTSLLTCQSNRFIDNSTNNFTITTNGTPKTQTFQPFIPPASYTTSTYGGSIYNAVKTDGLSVTSVAPLTTFTGDFTMECWVYPTDINFTGTWGLIDSRTSGQTPTSWVWSTVYASGGFSHAFYTGSQYSFTTKFPVNAWTHVVLQRNGTTLRSFINGVVDATTFTVSGTITGGSSTLSINNTKDNSLGSYGNIGYTSNLRIVNGTAVYAIAGFTPPTAPVTAIANTSLLLNYSNAGIYDAAVQNAELTVGSAQASTTQYKWAPASMKFNGTTDWLITQSTSNPCEFGSGNFTIEFWLYLNSTGTQVLLDARNTSSSNVAPLIYYQSGLKYYTAGLDRITGGTLSTATWYYIALVRSSGTTKLYINGTQTGSNYTDANVYVQQANRPIIGAEGVSVGTSPLNGYIQDLRITKGIARDVTSSPTTEFSITATTYTPTVPDAPIIANITTVTNTSVKIGYMAPLLNGGSTITSYTAVSTPGGITGTSVTSRSGTITVNGLLASNTYTFAVYATNAVGTSTFSASSKSVTTPVAQLGRIFILSDMDLALTNLVLLNTTVASGILKAKTYALATIYGSD